MVLFGIDIKYIKKPMLIFWMRFGLILTIKKIGIL